MASRKRSEFQSDESAGQCVTNNIFPGVARVFRGDPRGKQHYGTFVAFALSANASADRLADASRRASACVTSTCIFIKAARARKAATPAGKSEPRRCVAGKKKHNKNRAPARCDAARVATSRRTDVVYFHARLTSAPKHSVERSVTTRRCQRATLNPVRIGVFADARCTMTGC